MKKKLVDIAFRRSSLDIIEKANTIIEDYQQRGFTLTLRQLYYQFVARGLIPNAQSEYKRLGKIVNDGRLAGRIDWSAIEDRTRNIETPNVWRSPSAIIDAVARQYKEDLWKTQDTYVEVWVEKEALVGVIEGICDEYRVPYFACRGYASQSELFSAGERFRRAWNTKKSGVILHLGDHDPSGLDMTRDVKERMDVMVGFSWVDVRRLALNMDQIEEYNPPPNPAKDTDARFEGYQEEFGDSSWELDALDPDAIADLIRDQLEEIVDPAAWAEAQRTEHESVASLQRVADRWDEVVDFVADEPEEE
jgi:hypothetical protein